METPQQPSIATNPQINITQPGTTIDARQLQQIHMAIHGSSSYLEKNLESLLFSSRLVERLYITEDNPEGQKIPLLSHTPNNLMICPIKDCSTEIDQLPQVLNADNLPKQICDIHKKKLIWKNWNPPLTETGYHQVQDNILTAASSQGVGMGYLPQKYDVVTWSLEYSIMQMKAIYDNKEEWVNNRLVFYDDGFCYTLLNAIMANIEAVRYAAQEHLIDQILHNVNVSETRSYNPSNMQQKPKGMFDSFKTWLSGSA